MALLQPPTTYLTCCNWNTVDLVAVCDRYKSHTEAYRRLFEAREEYLDYDEMINNADIDAIFILTAPGTHVPFSPKALEAGKHILIQKPMATNIAAARKIAEEVRQAVVKALVEPSSSSSLDPDIAILRDLVKKGVLGNILWMGLIQIKPRDSAALRRAAPPSSW